MDLVVAQDLLDAGIKHNKIANMLGVERTKVSKLISSGKLEKYIAFDEEQTGYISEADIFNLFYINDDFSVSVDMDMKEQLMKQTRWGEKESSVFAEAKKEVELSAIDEFLLAIDPTEISYDLLKEYRHIETYIYRHYGDLPTFRKIYDIPTKYCDSSWSLYKYTELGYEFERLVSEVLSEISAGPIESQATQPDGSRPDFVINGSAWVDAKLSRSTTFNPQCKTLDKYASQADTLTIIYAIKDTKQADSRAEFIYVLSLLPLLSPELQQKVREFVSKAQVQRIGG